jgi:hypothetical protein
MIHTLNLTYNVFDAIEYYKKLQNNFKQLHWHYTKDHCDPRGIGTKNHMDNVHGWGLQTVYADITFPYHCDIDPHDEGPEYFKDTELVFGFFKEIKAKFVNPYRSFLMTFPAHHNIGRWLPGGPPHGKVFIPIITNSQATITDLTNNQTVILKEGNVYMFDMTTNYGEFKNEGDTAITFITFNVLADTFSHVLSTV